MDANQKAKSEFIRAYLDDAEAKVAFLGELAKTGHRDEATTLCLVYIDRFAQRLYWPSTSTGRNFVEALVQFGQDPFMVLGHPLQAARAFGRIKRWQTLAKRIETAFPGPTYELMPVAILEELLARYLPATELPSLKKELWRVTMANVVYQHFRNPAVHGFGVSGGLEFSQTTYNGYPIPILDLQRLKNAACSLIAEARRRSESNGQWFGNDRIVYGR